MFEAVIFDFDGVILDSEPIHFEAYSHVLNEIGLTISHPEYMGKYIGLSDKEIFPKLLKNKGLNASLSEIELFIERKIAFYTEILNDKVDLPLISDADLYINFLLNSKKSLAICSGASTKKINSALVKLNGGKLMPYFHTIITADNVQNGKPSPEGYLLAAERLKVPPFKCVVIEDSPHGVNAAKKAGMFVIALLTTHNRDQLRQADKIVNGFSDLLSGNVECP